MKKQFTAADFGYNNPTVIDLSDSTGTPTEVPYRVSDQWPSDGHHDGEHTACRKCASPLNSVAFALMFVSLALCCISVLSPFWIYYPKRAAVPELSEYHVRYPFKQARWRGLWAVCYVEVDLKPQITQSITPTRCIWFGQGDKGTAAWKAIPGWYDAAEVLFAMGMILLLLALVAETLFACCHLGLQRPLVPVVVASLTLGAGVMSTASLGLFGDQSFQEGELTPEPTGQEGELDWAFTVGIVGAVFTLVTSVLFYIDACWIWRKNDCRCR